MAGATTPVRWGSDDYFGGHADVSSEGGGGDSEPPPVVIVSSGAVGPFETAVIDSEDPQALSAWLRENGYDVPSEADPIIASYVAKNWYFVGLKLRKEAETGDLQPIVLRMDTNEACVPLRLTAIAAVEDMPVHVWFLADGRVVPLDWLEVTVNDARVHLQPAFDWLSLVSEAVDEVGGQAFVTDFSGSACALMASFSE